MTAAAGPYAGLDRFEARKRVVADLEALRRAGQDRRLPAQRSASASAARPSSSRWSPRSGSSRPSRWPRRPSQAVESGRIVFIPANWTKTYFEWMYNIRDWCISRQLWWGHRIPAWHCGECREIIVAREAPAACARCGSGELEQDPDVLDTWFSSGLWPFSTLGWPDQTEDLATLSTPPRCSSPASTSCSSGWPA